MNRHEIVWYSFFSFYVIMKIIEEVFYEGI